MESNRAMSVFRLVAKSTCVTSLVTAEEYACLQFRGASPCEMYMPCNCFLQDFFVHLNALTSSVNLTLPLELSHLQDNHTVWFVHVYRYAYICAQLGLLDMWCKYKLYNSAPGTRVTVVKMTAYTHPAVQLSGYVILSV